MHILREATIRTFPLIKGSLAGRLLLAYLRVYTQKTMSLLSNILVSFTHFTSGVYIA